MSYSNSDEIHGVLIQIGQEHLLLPNAAVVEVMSRVEVEALVNVPDWLVGQIAWHGWKVPLLALVGGARSASANNKVVVLKALGGHPSLPCLALLADAFPQLIAVPRDGLLVDASEEALPQGVHMRVLIGEQTALLPDLDAIEARTLMALREAA